MADSLDKIKDRIAKLLAKADSTACTVEEAEAFNRKAYELMAQYNLERADVKRQDKETLRTHKELYVLKRPWSTYILNGLTHLYFCRWVYSSHTKSADKITICGEETNVAVCHAVAMSILRAVQEQARKLGGRSFLTGAGIEINNRCYQMRPQIAIPNGGQSNALVVLANDEQTANKEYFNKLFGLGNIVKAKPSRPKVNSGEGFNAGRSYGRSVNLNSNLLKG